MSLLFACSLALLGYTYVGFPLAVGLLGRLFPARHASDPQLRPSVTVLLAAYNEERHIRGRLENLASLRYPTGKLRILVGSDGSGDRTVELARAGGLDNVEVHAFPSRQGKIAVLNRLAAMADSELLAFTDANTLWAPDALERLVRHFADPRVGGAGGRLRLKSASEDTRVESGYWDFESRLKAWESRLWTTIGASGAIYAIRANLWKPLPEDRPLMDDFVIGCRVVEQGKRMLFDPEAEAWEPTTGGLDMELRRKRRIFVANFCAVPVLGGMLRPGLPALLYVSHKLLRWLTPLLLFGLLAGALGMGAGPGRYMLAALGLVLGGALLYRVGLLLGQSWAPLNPVYYGVRLQWELLRGLAVAALGHPSPAWERSERSPP